MSKDHRPRRRARILVLAGDPGLLESLEEAVSEDCELDLHDEPESAIARLAERPYAGAVIDAVHAGRWLHAACKGYLERQPIGRIVMVARSDNPETLMRLAIRDPRVEVLFAPVRPELFFETLFGPRESDDAGERTRARRTMRWLLTR